MDCFWQNLTNSSCISCQWVFVASVAGCTPPRLFEILMAPQPTPPPKRILSQMHEGFSRPALWRETANGFHKPLIKTPVVSTCPSWSSTFGVNVPTEVYVGEGAVPKGTFFFQVWKFFRLWKAEALLMFLPMALSGELWTKLGKNSHIRR